MGRYDDPKFHADEPAQPAQPAQPATTGGRYSGAGYAAPPITTTDKLIQGLRDPIDGGAQLLEYALPQGAVDAINRANNWLAAQTGMVAPVPQGGVDELVRNRELAYQAQRAAAGEKGLDGWRLTGNVLSPANLAVASRVGLLKRGATLAQRTASAATVGAAQAELQPVTEGDFGTEKSKQVLLGGLFGAATAPVGSALSRVVSPLVSKEVALLTNEGVMPTIGQRFGHFTNGAEEKLMSIPFLGDIIGNARNHTRVELNTAALNRALAPIGAKFKPGVAGTEGFAAANDAIQAVYSRAESMLTGFPVDATARAELQNLHQLVTALPPNEQRAFNALMNDYVYSQMSPNGHFLAKTFSEVKNKLAAEGRAFSNSPDAYQQKLGDAILTAQRSLEDAVYRANPQADALRRSADAAWANLMPIEYATKAAAGAGGVFTPLQLLTGVKTAAKENSVRGRSVAKGEALMQDLAVAGQKVIGNKVPTSGTSERAMAALLAGGGGAYVLGNPAVTAGAGIATLPYLQGGRQLISTLSTARPTGAPQLAEKIRQSAPASAMVVSPLLQGILY